MSTVIAIGYPDQGTAEYARTSLGELESERAIKVDQAAVISRSESGHVHVHTVHHGAGSIWSGFWGDLFGNTGDDGIDPAFEAKVREHLQPGTSALLMVVEQMTRDEVIEALRGYGGTLIETPAPASTTPSAAAPPAQ